MKRMIEEAMKGIPPDPVNWVAEVYSDPASLHSVFTGFQQMERNPAWKFFRAALARKRDVLVRELRRAPGPGERDRSNEIRAVISVLESLLAVPADVEAQAKVNLQLPRNR